MPENILEWKCCIVNFYRKWINKQFWWCGILVRSLSHGQWERLALTHVWKQNEAGARYIQNRTVSLDHHLLSVENDCGKSFHQGLWKCNLFRCLILIKTGTDTRKRSGYWPKTWIAEIRQEHNKNNSIIYRGYLKCL